MPADLAEFRLLRAVRAGQPGAFPTLWNAQAGAVWSVIRALTATDVEAIGWATTFRIELSERVDELSPVGPVAAQVGLALYAHLREGFARDAALPEGPVPPTEEGVRCIPEAARLIYLVDLFFDVPIAAIERLAGPGARRVRDAVHRLLEPTDDTDARLFVHAALMRPAPIDVLILPPGAEPVARRPRWWIAVVIGAIVLLVASTPWIAGWFERPDLAELTARHHAALEDAPLRGSDPAALGLELTRRGMPALLADVPDLSRVELTLLGARIHTGAEPSVVLTYQGGARLWTLQHLLVSPDLSGTTPAASAPGLVALRSGEAAVVTWNEGSTTWVLAADAPPDAVLGLAGRILENRGSSDIPFLGEPGAAPPVDGIE